MSDSRYQIIKKIDAGGMAEIFLGKALNAAGGERPIAIKRVLPHLAENKKFIEMFLDEARLSIQLRHNNIVRVTDISRSDGHYFIVMEYIDGFNLRRIFQQMTELGQPISVKMACHIMIEVLNAVDYAHNKTDEKGGRLCIVHRDLSPPNILVSRDGEVKITDFGLAKAATQLNQTEPGTFKGKHAYLAPEVANGQSVDHRVDIFSAGIVLWELLAGRRLFLGRSDGESVELVRKAKVPSLHKLNSNIDLTLEAIVSRALAKDVRKRFASAREFGQALTQYISRNNLVVSNYEAAEWIKSLFDESNKDIRYSRERVKHIIDGELAVFDASTDMRPQRLASQPLYIADLPALESPMSRFDFGGFFNNNGVIIPLVVSPSVPAEGLLAMEQIDSSAQLIHKLEGQSDIAALAQSVRAVESKVPSWLWIMMGLAVIAVGFAIFLVTKG